MRVGMNAERFAALADAYGGDLRRWPAAERASAEAFVAGDPASAEPVLEAARRLDTALDSAPAAYPTPALRERVLAAAHEAGASSRRWRWPTLDWSSWGRGWLAPGAGVAAAVVAGAWLGVVAFHSAGAQLKADTVLVASADLSAGDLEESSSR
jgi:hypothetical protein